MATTPKSISGLTSAAAARVVLWQSREFVTVPGNAMGLQATIPATGLLPGTIGGTGMVLEVVGGVPAWVEPAVKYIVTGTFGGTEDDIDLSAVIAQGYTRFKAMWQSWSPSTAAILAMRFSNNAGSSFVSTGYLVQGVFSVPGTAAATAGSTDSAHLTLTCPAANTAMGYIEFSVKGSLVNWVSVSQSYSTGPVQGLLIYGGTLSMTGANAIRFMTSAGNSDGGTYTVHALKDF